MNPVLLFILFTILGIMLCMLVSRITDLKDMLEDAIEKTFETGMEISRKDFIIKMMKEEHKKEVAAIKLEAATVSKQNEMLIALIREEQKKKTIAEPEAAHGGA